MIEYCIGGFVVWLISGFVSIFTICMPCFEGDKWDTAPLRYCLIALLFGPFTQLCSAKAYNNALFNKD